ncbi:phage tail terminator-like protein [Pseudomonas sp. NA-150]|uniref:phage tail terminator-like protein n=1 Tax=Pseudomonas sp. NA-150 TaxID=3367525 RepID=UPI0037C97F88
MSHKIIRSLFEARLATWAKTRSPVLRIAYQNVAFTPAANETYLQAFTIPAGTDSSTLAGDHRLYTGLFQVSIVTPSGAGPGAADGLVDELAAVFPLNDRLIKAPLAVLIMTPVEPGPPVPDDSTYTVAASFQYRADTT